MKQKSFTAAVLFFILLRMLSFSAFAEAETYNCAAGQHKYILFSHTPATGESDGSDLFRCEMCGQEFESVLPSTGHNWSAWTTEKAPTCTQPGQRSRACDRHSPHTETEIIPALGHDYSVAETPPGCEKNGVMAYVCSRCGASYTEPGKPALGHDYIAETEKEPTCTEDGIKTFICSRDKSESYTERIPAAGHDFGEWAAEAPANEGGPGTEVRICGRCGEREEREIPALPDGAGQEDPGERQKPLNALDAACALFDLLLIALGFITLYPRLAAVHRVKKLWKQYLFNNKIR